MQLRAWQQRLQVAASPLHLQKEDCEPSTSITLVAAPGGPPQWEAVGMEGTPPLPTELGLGMSISYQKAERTLEVPSLAPC